MNIVVSVMILCTCALLIIISNGAYNKTVIEPYVLKMEGIKVDTEAMKPFLAHFLNYVGTEELDAIWTEDREERAGRLMDWMQQQPSFLPNAEDEERTLLNDWVDFSLMPVNIRADGDLNAVDVAVPKTWRRRITAKRSGIRWISHICWRAPCRSAWTGRMRWYA